MTIFLFQNVTSCAWFPDGLRFMTGSLDKHMYMWHVDGRELKAWQGSDRVNDLALSPDGTHLVGASIPSHSMHTACTLPMVLGFRGFRVSGNYRSFVMF